MRARSLLPFFLILVGLVLQVTGSARAFDHVPGIQTVSEDGGVGREVVVLPIDGTIDMGLAPFVRRVVRENPDAAAIILDVDTFGGRVDAAVQIRDALLDARPPVIAYIDHRAISAGALISYAADEIVFAPGSSMGAATPITIENGEASPVDEKMTSYMRAEMRTTAEANGRRGDIAESMVDRSLVVEDIIDEGKLLTVTTEDAVRIGLADGTAANLSELLEQLGLERAERITVQTTWAEKLARIFTDPTVAGLLMSLGMLGLMMELYTPGFGFTGAFGLTCLALFFGGHMLVELAGWEEALFLLVGLILLGIEVFVTPGFGVVGVVGLALMVGGLASSLVGLPLSVSWELGLLGSAVQRVLVSLAATIVLMALLIQFVPTRMLPGWLILRTQLSSHGDGGAEEAVVRSSPEQSHLVGQQGLAVTDLRLAGKARFGDALVDVVSLHQYITRGAAVRVLQVEGSRVVVDLVDPEPNTPLNT